MARRGRPPLPRGVFAFDAPEWEPPEAVVLDTNVVAEALLPKEPEHAPCLDVLELLANSGTTVVFSRLLEIELWEVIFNLALRERHPRKNIRHVRYDNRVRPRACCGKHRRHGKTIYEARWLGRGSRCTRSQRMWPS